ncbi:hypothetical protein B0T17DRAFT_308700 [Bombardia bombarda]|uniref:Uncharacterized protein n=1 Tax=Bombardia bombarda TaxID=252184 RepID=A0AA39WUV9_9PEZI|nr:hypothetical protein B0T17DRAFT_308700 [Bombardia bombarda]
MEDPVVQDTVVESTTGYFGQVQGLVKGFTRQVRKPTTSSAETTPLEDAWVMVDTDYFTDDERPLTIDPKKPTVATTKLPNETKKEEDKLDTAEQVLQRLRETQPPRKTLEPEQTVQQEGKDKTVKKEKEAKKQPKKAAAPAAVGDEDDLLTKKAREWSRKFHEEQVQMAADMRPQQKVKVAVIGENKKGPRPITAMAADGEKLAVIKQREYMKEAMKEEKREQRKLRDVKTMFGMVYRDYRCGDDIIDAAHEALGEYSVKIHHRPAKQSAAGTSGTDGGK